MLKKLSRIFGITGGALALLANSLSAWIYISPDAYHDIAFIPTAQHSDWPVFDLYDRFTYDYTALFIAAVVLSLAGLITAFFILRKPLFAGIALCVSGCICFALTILPVYYIFWGILAVSRAAASLMIIAAGVLAFISARRTPVSDKPQG